MGGEKFETSHPETFLFGENSDLNFLGNKPGPFPYPPPQAHEPTKTLRSLVNIRKDSIRLVKVMNSPNQPEQDDPNSATDVTESTYSIEFTFDTDVNIAITIYYFAMEELLSGRAVYTPIDPSMTSPTYHYKRGINQTFSQPTHVIQPEKFPEEQWLYHPDKGRLPIVIQCVVDDEQHSGGHHSHASFASIERSADGSQALKALKQKQTVDGLCYLLQEIYGIENKSLERQKLEEEFDDNGSECVICMCESRDTLILPCRHLCLCVFCADNLRYQASNCPICRAPFRALLQVRAMRKKTPPLPSAALPTARGDDDLASPSQDGVPASYEAVYLIDALNGPQSQCTTNNTYTQTMPTTIPRTAGHSPNLKRKHRRSSARNSRHGRRLHGNRDDAKRQQADLLYQVVPPPTQVATSDEASGHVSMTSLKLYKAKPKAASGDATDAAVNNQTSRKSSASSAVVDDATRDAAPPSDLPIIQKSTSLDVVDSEQVVLALNNDEASPKDSTTLQAVATDNSEDMTSAVTTQAPLAASNADPDDVTLIVNNDNDVELDTAPVAVDVSRVHAEDDDDTTTTTTTYQQLDAESEVTMLKVAPDSSASSYSSTCSAKALLDGATEAADSNTSPYA